MKCRSQAYLGLGCNAGNHYARIASLHAAVKMVAQTRCIRIEQCSSIYRSPPWGYEQQEDFYNAAILAATTLKPDVLLRKLKDIERCLGRVPVVRWGPRIIDIDILLFGNVVMDTPDLVIPHPYLLERPFAFAPVLEINPKACLPDGRSLAIAVPDSADSSSLTIIGALNA